MYSHRSKEFMVAETQKSHLSIQEAREVPILHGVPSLSQGQCPKTMEVAGKER